MSQVKNFPQRVSQGADWRLNLSRKRNVQTVTILAGGGDPGTWQIGWKGALATLILARMALASDVQRALEGLAGIGRGNVNVSGAAGGPYSVQWIGRFGGGLQDPLIAFWTFSTGGVVVAPVPFVLTYAAARLKVATPPGISPVVVYADISLTPNSQGQIVQTPASGLLACIVVGATTAGWTFGDPAQYDVQTTAGGGTIEAWVTGALTLDRTVF